MKMDSYNSEEGKVLGEKEKRKEGGFVCSKLFQQHEGHLI